VNIPQNVSLQPSTDISVSAWVMFNTVPADWGTNKILSNSVLLSPYSGYWLDVVPGGMLAAPFTSADSMKVRFHLSTVNGAVQIFSAAPISVGVWHHIVGVYSATRQEIYIDGTLSVDQALTSSMSPGTGGSISYGNNTNIKIGYWDSFSHFNGAIDEVRIYNRVLTAAEIANL